ncbi:phospholipase A and acyltransferase 5-like [Channa argus]
MKKLILVAFVFQLVILINAYQFGDIVSFLRTKKCVCVTLSFKHFAVYVGNEAIDGKTEPDQDIFHHTGPSRHAPGCVFGKLAEEGDGVLENYLDKTHPPGDHDTILKRINEKKSNCGQYSLFRNNCEHLATYVRNGVAQSKQPGTDVASWTVFCKKEKGSKVIPEDVLEVSDDLEAVPCDRICNSCNQDSGAG